jgi:hypothetical protein
MHFNKWNIPKYALLSFTIFFDLEEIIFENFNISENNIISVKLAKVLGYIPCGSFKCYSLQRRCYHTGQSLWVTNQSSSKRFFWPCLERVACCCCEHLVRIYISTLSFTLFKAMELHAMVLVPMEDSFIKLWTSSNLKVGTMIHHVTHIDVFWWALLDAGNVRLEKNARRKKLVRSPENLT